MVKTRRVLKPWVKAFGFAVAFNATVFAVFYLLPLLFGHAGGGRP